MSHSDMVIILPKEVFSRFGPSCFKVKRQIYHKLSQIKHLWLVNPEPRSQIVLYEHLTIWPYWTNSTELESLRPMVNHVPLFFFERHVSIRIRCASSSRRCGKTLKAALRSTTTGAMTTTLARQRPRSYAALTERGSTPSFMRTVRWSWDVWELIEYHWYCSDDF